MHKERGVAAGFKSESDWLKINTRTWRTCTSQHANPPPSPLPLTIDYFAIRYRLGFFFFIIINKGVGRNFFYSSQGIFFQMSLNLKINHSRLLSIIW